MKGAIIIGNCIDYFDSEFKKEFELAMKNLGLKGAKE